MSKTLYWAKYSFDFGHIGALSKSKYLRYRLIFGFDSIEWNFLIKALETFGFGNMLVKWIKTVYTKPESCVTNNGFTTLFFSWERGVRQGCPLSGILFVIAIELQACATRIENA